MSDCECRCHSAKTPYVCWCGGWHNDPKPARDPNRNQRGVQACRAALAARERATDGTATDAAETEKPQ